MNVRLDVERILMINVAGNGKSSIPTPSEILPLPNARGRKAPETANEIKNAGNGEKRSGNGHI